MTANQKTAMRLSKTIPVPVSRIESLLDELDTCQDSYDEVAASNTATKREELHKLSSRILEIKDQIFPLVYSIKEVNSTV